MSTDLKPSGFSLKIKNFEKYPDPVKLKDQLIKDLKDRFTKVFSPPGLPPGSFSIFKEVLKDEIILTDLLTLDQGHEVIEYIKESDKYKKLSILSVQIGQQSEERTMSDPPQALNDFKLVKETSQDIGPKTDKRRIAMRKKDIQEV